MGIEAMQQAARQAKDFAWSSGVCVGAVANLLQPLSSACVKLLHGHIPIFEICLFRSLLAWICSVALGTATRVRPLWGHRRNAPLLITRGVCGTLSVLCNYTAVSLLPLGDAAGLNMIKPCVVALMAWVVLGEPMGAAGAAGLLVSLGGVLVLVHPPSLLGGGHVGWGHDRIVGTAAALGSSVFAAGVALCIRKIGKSDAALTVALAFHSCTIAMSTPPLALAWPQRAVVPTPHQVGLLIGVAMTSFAAQVLLTRSFQLLPAGRASALSFTTVIYGHILGLLIFGERLTATSFLGSLIILIGVLLTTAKFEAKQPPLAPGAAAPAVAGAALPTLAGFGGGGGGGGGASGSGGRVDVFVELGRAPSAGGKGSGGVNGGGGDREDEEASLLQNQEWPQQTPREQVQQEQEEQQQQQQQQQPQGEEQQQQEDHRGHQADLSNVQGQPPRGDDEAGGPRAGPRLQPELRASSLGQGGARAQANVLQRRSSRPSSTFS